MLAEARERTGLAVVTEVIGVETLPDVAEYADVLQIGARNMQHYPLLEAVGKVNKPVLLKRGMYRDARRVPPGGRVHHQRGQPEGDPLRAGRPNVRGLRPQHADAGDHSRAAGARRTCR